MKEIFSITKKIFAFIRDSTYLIEKLNYWREIKINQYILIIDIAGMYTNIKIDKGIAAILLSFQLKIAENDENYSINPLIKTLLLLIK